MSFIRPLGWKVVVLAVLAVLFVGAGTGAAVCKFTDAACGIGSDDLGPLPTSIDEFSERGQGEMSLEDGLTGAIVVSGLKGPTDFDFLPDGRILVAEKDGLIRVVEGGRLARKSFLDLRGRINNQFFRGIVNITVDPDFPRNSFIYVVYSLRGRGGANATEPTSARVSRFEVSGDAADPESETILLGKVNTGGKPCRTFPRGTDCLPNDGYQIGAGIEFTRDDTILISTGDGGGVAERPEPASFLVQDETARRQDPSHRP